MEKVPAAPYRNERTPDEQYQELLNRLLKEGKTSRSGMDEESKQVLGHTMRFDVSNGFPMITERDLMASSRPENIIDWTPREGRPERFRYSARQGLGEILGFINGARTVEQLAEFGNKWWSMWATEEKCAKRGLEPGDLGPGSYGAAFHDYPMPEVENVNPGSTFNQFAEVVQQIKERPELRTHIVTPFIPPYILRKEGWQQGVVVVPCHGDLRFDVDTERSEISLVHKQRSADVPVGLPFNMIHYGAVLHMMAEITGYTPKEIVYFIDNAHMYKRHYEVVEEILDRDPKAFPKLLIDPEKKSIFDYRIEDFAIEEYDPHPPVDMGGTPI